MPEKIHNKPAIALIIVVIAGKIKELKRAFQAPVSVPPNT
jgi:hypothetical protein